MRYRIIVLPKGGVDALTEWSETGIVQVSKRGDGRSSEWSRLCRNIVRWTKSGKIESAELCLCLLKDELRGRRDIGSLRRLLTWAREHTWASKLFLVVSDTVRLSEELQRGKEALRQWLDAGVQGKALDLLQVEYDPDQAPESIPKSQLRDAASRAYDRQQVLAMHHPFRQNWLCVPPPERPQLANFLFPLVQLHLSRDERTHLLIVVDSGEEDIQVATVKKAIRRFRDRHYIVANMAPRSSDGLLDLCRQKGLGDPVMFRGEFELWYFILRLNDRSRLTAPEPTEYLYAGNGSTSELSAQAVSLNESPIFRSWSIDDRPAVLVTSSFDPRELGQCLEAALDIGWLVERAPIEISFRFLVEPAITRRRLLRLFDRLERDMLDCVAWIHLGHGDGVNGLWESGSKEPVPAEKWLQCFRSRNIAIPLALFLTCYSGHIAASFAKEGAGVAIGFNAEVESNKCRVLADQIIKSVLTKGWSRMAILQGFFQGCSDLIAIEDGVSSDPVAFFPAYVNTDNPLNG